MKAAWLITLAMVVAGAIVAPAAVIWDEPFDGARTWGVVWEQDSGSSVNISSGMADLYVDAASSHTAFGPSQVGDFCAAFDPAHKSDYTLYFTVDSVSWSTSYTIALDEFDSSKNYVNTVWQVYPTSGSSVDTGTISVNLGSYTFHGGVAYVAPKIDTYTGDGGQTITFDRIYVDQAEGGGPAAAPEPGSLLLMGAGALSLCMIRPRRTRSTGSQSKV